MKKFAIISLAALLVVAFTLPAAAFENVFGGYWRTRAYTEQNYFGSERDNGDEGNISLVDTRTRLYYTAKLSDNFKFVNKFEMDAVWGDQNAANGYGDIGADGVRVEVKNTYADFDMGPVNSKIGVQGFVLARGFLADDDFAGALVSLNNDLMSLPVFWFKAYEGGTDNNTADTDIFGIAPSFNLGDALKLTPYAVYWMSDNLEEYQADGRSNLPDTASPMDDADVYFVGFDADLKLDVVSLWFTGIYEMGTIDFKDGDDTDIAAFLVGAGAALNFGPAELHSRAFYASGDDDPEDNDVDSFIVIEGQSYYWSEIMGFGIFDNVASAGSPADQISNVWAVNLGATFKLTDKLSITPDVWYANLAEENEFGEDELGIEADLKVTYKLMENLNLDVVGAYLFAGDATSETDQNENDPYLVGTRLSLSF
ncbi:MAG: alginate export family protein [Desulfobacterales bacterium]|nr:alginate export family protein [Desulfobacterales bacterium]